MTNSSIQTGSTVILPGVLFFSGKDKVGVVAARVGDMVWVNEKGGMQSVRYHVTRVMGA